MRHACQSKHRTRNQNPAGHLNFRFQNLLLRPAFGNSELGAVSATAQYQRQLPMDSCTVRYSTAGTQPRALSHGSPVPLEAGGAPFEDVQDAARRDRVSTPSIASGSDSTT